MRFSLPALRRVWLPQNNVGSWAWLLHRLSGIALVLYLIPHFITIHSARGGAAAFDQTLAWYAGPVIALSEFVLVLVVVFHLANGLRIIATDFLDLNRHQKLLFWVVMALCAGVMIAASTLFVPKILAGL